MQIIELGIEAIGKLLYYNNSIASFKAMFREYQ